MTSLQSTGVGGRVHTCDLCDVRKDLDVIREFSQVNPELITVSVNGMNILLDPKGQSSQFLQ